MMQARKIESFSLGHEIRSVRKRYNPNWTFAIEKMWSNLGSDILIVCGSTSKQREKAFQMGFQRFYREVFEVIVGDSKAKIGLWRTAEDRHIGTNGISGTSRMKAVQFHHVDHAIHDSSHFQKPFNLQWNSKSLSGQTNSEMDPLSSIGSSA
uniref:N-acetyltransferase domain-containing protein n=1 Tax=Haemonchus contortus TaxID=6289 RepID=A0A7I4Z2G6_HAECO